MRLKSLPFLFFYFFIVNNIFAQPITGAAQLDTYLPLLKGKRVGCVVNQTSRIADRHLVDTLLAHQIRIKKIFSPEHGFRGTADAGEKVNSTLDERTGLPIVSLYGSNKKPTPEQLKDLDVVLFDIQDVGVRFYTYISTMHYVMEACAENNIPVLVLDRPNPNGFYIDGPVLDTALRSFVGLHPIPIVHGLTVGELAQMINGEGWLKGSKTCSLMVVKNLNYTHQTPYSLPVRPSPNLPNDLAIRLYPSLCLFEGTSISVGRGTELPFQLAGSPDYSYDSFDFPSQWQFITFTPESKPGAAKNPLYEHQTCYGLDMRTVFYKEPFSLRPLIFLYQHHPEPDKFFNKFFRKLAGTNLLQQQIQDGWSEEAIRATWQPELERYKQMRQKYLLYAE